MQVTNHPTLLLIGAGQIGSRYLQGLSFYEDPLNIFVVDPSSSSLGLAKERFLQIAQNTIHNVTYLPSLDSICSDIDIVFITTPANCRLEVVNSVVSSLDVKYWILEKVLAQSSQQTKDIYTALSNCEGAWVNTSRRLIHWHKRIKEYIKANHSGPLSVRVTGGNWSLACNAIHFIDYVSWLTNSQISSISSDDLQTWFPSKRKGFYEIYGDMCVYYSDDSSLFMSCHDSTDNMTIEVITHNESIIIDENLGIAASSRQFVLHGELTFQSLLTSPLVSSLLTLGTCDLPTLSESVEQHVFMLDSFSAHWNRVNLKSDCTIPIT